MEVIDQAKNPYLTTIVKDKRDLYPNFGDKILEFSIFDVSIDRSKNGNPLFIGVKILGEKEELMMIKVKHLNFNYNQRVTIRDSFITKKFRQGLVFYKNNHHEK